MGIVRFLLAAAVVIGHAAMYQKFPNYRFCEVLRLLNPSYAVHAFFVISGFYMALVLTEKYRHLENGRRTFYINRYLRLAPTYWFICATMIVVSLLCQHSCLAYWVKVTPNSSTIGKMVFMAVSNLTLFGQDLMFFTNIDSVNGYYFIIIPPAWSIGTELCFYALAPFLVRIRTRWICLLLVCTFLLRSTICITFPDDPNLQQKVFPSELFFFLTGMLSYRFYQNWLRPRRFLQSGSWWGPLACLILCSFILLNGYMKTSLMRGPLKVEDNVLIALLFFLLIPVVFHSSRFSTMDRFIGDLSYPVYMWHWCILTYCPPAQEHWRGGLLLLLTVFVSIPTVLLLERPLERWRHKLIKFGSKAEADEPLAREGSPIGKAA